MLLTTGQNQRSGQYLPFFFLRTFFNFTFCDIVSHVSLVKRGLWKKHSRFLKIKTVLVIQMLVAIELIE